MAANSRNIRRIASLALVWAQYGPYHLARASALVKMARPTQVHLLEVSSRSSDYQWNRPLSDLVITPFCPGATVEQAGFGTVFRGARRILAELGGPVCLLPSYAPKQSLAALLAAKSLRLRTVMMNDSHAGTARARGIGAWMKRRLVGLFDAALVAGHPQRRHFAALGLPRERIFTGYDAVDNDYFARRAEEVRGRRSEVGGQYDLPEHYFLSVGRFVAKKNLATLLQAYRQFLDASRVGRTHLVLVGSGEEEPKLRALCGHLRLPIYDKTPAGIEKRKGKIGNGLPGVHFYGFRQIEENPVFYALADAFILPSLWEEWGLVVNEAMACGLPVVVSETAGCVEDLLKPGRLVMPRRVSAGLEGRLGQLAGRIRQNGFLFNPASPQSLASALMVLQAVPEIRENMGKASRVLIGQFSCENFARNALLAARAAMGDGPAVEDETLALPAKLTS